MIEPITMYALRCDECGATLEYSDESGFVAWETAEEIIADLAEWEWSEDGHGKHLCPRHTPLVLDPVVAQQREDDRTRAITDADVPLDFGNLT